MKKAVLGSLLLVLAIAAQAYAASDFKILELRNRFFEESKQVKDLLPSSKDPAVLVSMYNSCVLSITQLDAYFGMLGVLEGLKGEPVSANAFDVISNWLYEIKRTNALNISTVEGMLKLELTPDTKDHLARMKAFYAESNARIDGELSKLNVLKKTVKPVPVAAAPVSHAPAGKAAAVPGK